MRHKREAPAVPLRPRPDSLVVRESKRWQVGVFLSKVCQSVDHSSQLWGQLWGEMLKKKKKPHNNSFTHDWIVMRQLRPAELKT